MTTNEINTVLSEAHSELLELHSGIWAVGESISESSDLHTSCMGNAIASMAKRLSDQVSKIELELRSLGIKITN